MDTQSRLSHAPGIKGLVLVVWLKIVTPLYGRLSLNILREVRSYVPRSPLLFASRNSTLIVFNPLEGINTSAAAPAYLQCEPAYCLMDQVTALCLGGHPATAEVITLNLLTFATTNLPVMQQARELPGLCYVENDAYVFGGFCSHWLQSCEMFSRDAWQPLPNLRRPRCAFPPCVFGRDIFLPCASSYLEIFSTTEQQFTIVPVSSDVLVKQSVSFVIEEQLVVVTSDGNVGRWNVLKRNNEFAMSRIVCVCEDVAVSCCVPVLINKQACWVTRIGGHLAILDLDQMTMTVS